MARYDKIHMQVRAMAGTALATDGDVLAVKLNAGGSIVPAAATDALGVIIVPGTISAGYPASFMVRGEIVEFGGSVATGYYSAAGGTVGTASGGGATKVGFTVEGDRLVVTM